MVCRVCTLLLLAASAAALRPALPATQHRRRRGAVTMMGRKFENNKLKMAKTALAYAHTKCIRVPALNYVRLKINFSWKFAKSIFSNEHFFIMHLN